MRLVALLSAATTLGLLALTIYWERPTVTPLRRPEPEPEPKLPDSEDVNVLALVKGREYYVLLYCDAYRAEALRTCGRFASDPELSFTWYDAATLAQKITTNPRNTEVSHAGTQPEK